MISLEISKLLYARLCQFGEDNGIKEGESLIEFALAMAEKSSRVRGVSNLLRELKQAGYKYDFARHWYVQTQHRKVISMQFVADHSLETICAAMAEHSPSTDWQFYFLEEPTPAVREQLIALLPCK
jgi:hypothetical protein